ncbi:MAG: hypothetical protein IJT36_01815 [Alphaproteobacteria bacterium]|nr:hypothetical protein [Alphaproteobacteria bacterium]
MLNVMIGKSGRPVVTGSGMFGYGISCISETSRSSKVHIGAEEYASFDNAVNQLVEDGMTPNQAYKYARKEAVI